MTATLLISILSSFNKVACQKTISFCKKANDRLYTRALKHLSILAYASKLDLCL